MSLMIFNLLPGQRLLLESEQLGSQVSVELVQKSGRAARLVVQAARDIRIEKKDTQEPCPSRGKHE
jgi:hypothetical protein